MYNYKENMTVYSIILHAPLLLCNGSTGDGGAKPHPAPMQSIYLLKCTSVIPEMLMVQSADQNLSDLRRACHLHFDTKWCLNHPRAHHFSFTGNKPQQRGGGRSTKGVRGRGLVRVMEIVAL